jgi:hypothetical protein
MESFATRLIHARSAQGLTPKELAEKCEMAQTQLSRYENGKAIPRRAVIERLALAMHVNPDWLKNGASSSAASVQGAATGLTESADGNPQSHPYSLYFEPGQQEQLQQEADKAGRPLHAEITARLNASMRAPAARQECGNDRLVLVASALTGLLSAGMEGEEAVSKAVSIADLTMAEMRR